MFNEQQLRSYLAWSIHGRKPQHRATSATRGGPARDKDYLELDPPLTLHNLRNLKGAAKRRTLGPMEA
jgi:hypothetical protein